VLKTPVSVESSEMEKLQIRSGIMRVVKRLGTTPPPKVSAFSQCAVDGIGILLLKRCQELFPIVKQELAKWMSLKYKAFQACLEALLAEGLLVKADIDTGSVRIAAVSSSAAGGGVAPWCTWCWEHTLALSLQHDFVKLFSVFISEISSIKFIHKQMDDDNDGHLTPLPVGQSSAWWWMHVTD
jgi:hypothetical protein